MNTKDVASSFGIRAFRRCCQQKYDTNITKYCPSHEKQHANTTKHSSVTLSYSTLSCYFFFLFAWFWSLGNSQVSQPNFLCLIYHNIYDISFQGTGFYLVWVTLYRMFEMWSWTDQSDGSMMVLGARLCALSSTRTTQHEDNARAEVPQK